MSNKKILVYVTKEVIEPLELEKTNFIRWTPSITSIIPKGKPKSYFIYSLFLFFRIFKNKKYYSFHSLDGHEISSSFLVLPAHYRWPFMQLNSIQFTYVVTKKEYRGRGLAWVGIYQAYLQLKNQGIEYFWYITDSENIASQKLAKKMGFNLVGSASRKDMLFGLIKKLQLNEAI